ncbi:MAG: enoyl-CoA hydratase/isomerase family protein [Kofleriaceae bacterium]|nr:enoyl-CoA hydratase/isomerase family protein [Myxococcales bacterium]MCB9560526.1 enoyl-CoA hydratase/isomerase family protein [Kofleriaceae bacterium]MCB9573298.1 enoyl-CoA hydratase/isomerase family protein [Kofleriaceae bacterium]
MAEPIIVERTDAGVAWVTLNRPEARNALSKAVNLELARLARELSGDRTVRAVVLTGAGDKVFCAGADLKERKGVPAAESGPYIDAISGAIEAWARIAKPVVCAMNGSAYGGGLELALACDFRIGVVGAEVGLTEVRLGIMPGAGGTQRLPRLIGVAAAKEMILLGRRVSAERAASLGLMLAVVPPAELRAAVDGVLAELAACAPRSVALAKAAIERGSDVVLDEGLRIERQCYDVTLFSADRDEGLLAFAEKRPPRFTGR